MTHYTIDQTKKLVANQPKILERKPYIFVYAEPLSGQQLKLWEELQIKFLAIGAEITQLSKQQVFYQLL